ncbi:MAG: hypothetical protein II630_09075 [Bacteroidales bacterium]|nr:hypothetical protein [Bacteroidales bacterium]
MRKIDCVEPGIIVDGTVLKDGSISNKNRREVTKECVMATMKHITCISAFQNDGISGYQYGNLLLVLLDTERYKIINNEGREIIFGGKGEE